MGKLFLVGVGILAGYYIGKDARKEGYDQHIDQVLMQVRDDISEKLHLYIKNHIPDKSEDDIVLDVTAITL